MPEDVDPRQLDAEVRQDLRSLSKETAELVAKHLVMTGRLLEDEPQRALEHARAAGALAGRIAAVREAVGLAAYTAGSWAEALSELRTARRISGRPEHLPVLADCERALGRPERALALLDDPDVARLDPAVRVELVIVVAGARLDLGQADAAVLLLQDPARQTTIARSWAARLWYAYAGALLAAGRHGEAVEWFHRTVDADHGGETDADERLLQLDGVIFQDLQDDGGDDVEAAPGPAVDLAALLAGAQVSGAVSAPTPAADPERDVVERAVVERAVVERAVVERAVVERAVVGHAVLERAEAGPARGVPDAEVPTRQVLPTDGGDQIGVAAVSSPGFSDEEQAPRAGARPPAPPVVNFAEPTTEVLMDRHEVDAEVAADVQHPGPAVTAKGDRSTSTAKGDDGRGDGDEDDGELRLFE